MSKKVQVSFSDRQIELLASLKGELGDSESEIVRAIVISWLSEKEIITDSIRGRLNNNVQATNKL